jgi:hypothetical protein
LRCLLLDIGYTEDRCKRLAPEGLHRREMGPHSIRYGDDGASSYISRVGMSVIQITFRCPGFTVHVRISLADNRIGVCFRKSAIVVLM